MLFSPETLEKRTGYLTPALTAKLRSSADGTDPFTTGAGETPKAFRVGECKEISSGRTQLQILLFWRDDKRSEQREIFVETQKVDGRWLIDEVQMPQG